MKVIGANFIRHCDNESCDLGAFQYTCPNCNKVTSDYEIWWKQDDIMYNELNVIFDCSSCKASLTAYWSDDEFECLITQTPTKKPLC